MESGQSGNENPSWKNPRACGALLLCGALYFFYVGTYQPVSEALAGAQSVTYRTSVVLLQIPMILIGAVMVVCGQRTAMLLGTRTAPTKLQWLVLAVGFLMGVGYELYLVDFLRGHGYPVASSIFEAWKKLLGLAGS